MTPISVYIHVPFCAYRCSYCDFNTYTSLADLKPAYTEALVQEIATVTAGRSLKSNSVFLGGGTPTLMASEQLEQIFDQLHLSFAELRDGEVTMEANPETVDRSYLTALRQMGINRLSFGAQSAIDSELTLLGRGHTFDTVRTAVADARWAGFENLSIDLIYGVPGQTLESWRQTVEAAVALDTPHLSLYCLTIEPGTPMQRWLLGGEIEPPDPDLAADQYELTCDLLGQHGYDHYEISNWARPGYESRHNKAYWLNESYLGLGAGAHGHAAGLRYHVVRQPRTYIRRLLEPSENGRSEELSFPLSAATAGHATLTQEEMMSDTIIMGLRLLNEGVSESAFWHRFGLSISEKYSTEIRELTALELVDWSAERQALTLTRKGWFLSNRVFREFV